MSTYSHDSCTDLLRTLIQFDTVNGNVSGKKDAELELSLYLEAAATALGLVTRRLAVAGESFNLLISRQVAEDAPWLLFESHLDTVSVERMTVDPFGAVVDNGRIYGRGACDTKSSGAAMFWALQKYLAEGLAGNNVAILYTLDEEVGKTGIRTFVDQHLSTLGWRPAGVVVGEPTELRPIVAHNGVVRWTVRTEGVAAHSSDPSQGRSAISKMVKVIQCLESKYIPSLTASHPLTGKAQCSINMIRGGVQFNIIPESCEICVDRRVVPGENPQAVLPAVEELLNDLRKEEEDLVVATADPFVDPPLDPAQSGTFSAFVQRVLTQLSLPAELTGVRYATDASNVSAAGVPAVVIGPGHIAQAHTADEWLELEQLEKAVEVYLSLMRAPLGMYPEGRSGKRTWLR